MKKRRQMSRFYACRLTLAVTASGQVSALQEARTDVKQAQPPKGFYGPIRSCVGPSLLPCDLSRCRLRSASLASRLRSCCVLAVPDTSRTGHRHHRAWRSFFESVPLALEATVAGCLQTISQVTNYTLHNPRLPVNEESVKMRQGIKDFL
ncbi:MAG: hypothetical protein MUC60_12650 [Oscillatoria sp. Prado101]|nr:hypothetical protein [Oscillatoria sp. Prado101]